MNNQQLWQAVLGELELSISKANFTTWFGNTGIASRDGNKATISVPNTFTQTWLEKKYHQSILKSLRALTTNEEAPIKEVIYKVCSIKVQFQAEEEEEIQTMAANSQFEPQGGYTATSASQVGQTPRPNYVNEFGINEKYNFNNFIVGKNSELAYAASQAVSQNPGKSYNPLFIYGGVGLGKTHLIQAIGNTLLQQNPNYRILYASCEKFTNDFITAVKSGKASQFQQKYRNVDLLLIDDIQFITGKEGTQEAFFHTFNALHQNDKQIVITSDRPPKAISGIEERLLSRFEWGMICDVSHPDLETRIAILESKCTAKGIDIDGEIVQFMAESIQDNIRELEGALNRIIAQHELQGIKPTIDSVRRMLSGMKVSGKKKAINADQVLDLIIDFYGISLQDLLGASRKKTLVIPRQIAMYILREEMRHSFPQIGEQLGGRDHTTAMHACQKISRLCEEDEQLKQEINSLKQRLYSTVS